MTDPKQPDPPAPQPGTTTDLSGRELTLQTPAPATDLSGRELTLQTPAPATDLSGRELTLQTPAPATDLSGRELTLQTPSTGITGRELTMQTPTGATDLSGRELTLQTPPLPSGTPTPVTMGGKPKTEPGFKPRTGTATSVAFDDAWHLSGRKGPFTGQTWGDFELGGIIGEGGMGAVYRAKQRSLKRRVAIKVLPPNLAADHRLLSRFHLEAATASKLQSPHVVQVYFIGEHEGNHYYAMEFVEGKDLYDVMKERREAGKPITPDEAVDYILQAAKGLAEAGRNGVVHRDIKPPNLMVTKGGLVKIADFGIVKVLGEHHLTMTGQAVGTPAYVSPEQGRGDREVDPRSDLYSLGVVFYEIACGKKPFEGTTPNALIYQHCYEEPKLPKEANPAISDEIQAVILRCLQKKPENRYQAADELARDLELIKTGQMMASAIANYKRGTGADEAKREQMNWFQRHLLPIAAAAVLVVAGGGGVGWYLMDKAAKEREDRALAAGAGEKAVAEKRGALAKGLDVVLTIPEGVEARLAELATLAKDGDADSDIVRWRAKIRDVSALVAKLEPIQEGLPTVAARQQARADLDALVAKVGAADPQAQRAAERLKKLDDDEAALRAVCAKLDTEDLKESARKRYGERLAELARLAPDNDPQLAKWNRRLATFDAELKPLLERIAPLDADQQVTVAERLHYLPVLSNLSVYLDIDDPRLVQWRNHLESANKRADDLRSVIGAVVGAQLDRISRPKFDQIADKLKDYEAVAGADDPQLKDWKTAIDSGTRAIDSSRKRLSEWATQADDGVLPAAVLAPFAADLGQLDALVYGGDADVLKWRELHRASERVLGEWRSELKVLEPTAEAFVTAAAQADLAAKLGRLVAKGGIEAERAEVYRNRLATEARRIADLRTALGTYDRAVPITDAMGRGLEQLGKDVGADDADVRKWTAKAARVADLASRIGAIDRREPVPEDLDQLFTEFERLCGAEEPRLVGWRGKVQRINEARRALAVLDRRAVFNAADVAKALESLRELVGDKDRGYVRWMVKAGEVAALKRALALLPQAIAQAPEAQAAAHARLRRLHQLVGSDDTDLQAAALRQAELDGPPRPVWAIEAGRDAYGPWVETELPGGRQRFRLLVSGTVRVGSPDGEAGRDADEVPVALTLPRAFWLADSEVTRAQWQAIAGSDPSRGRSDPRLWPVERVTWDDARRHAEELSRRVSGLVARLPLEAEWEYACRAGDARAWALPTDLAADADGVAKLAWHDGNSGGQTHEVRTRLPNPLGLFDLHGNIAEWCADGYGPYPTSAAVVTAPATGDGRKVVRGGSWGDAWLKTRAANRIPARADLASAYVGLRLAADVEWGGSPPDGQALLARLSRGGNQAVEFGVAGWRVQVRREDKP